MVNLFKYQFSLFNEQWWHVLKWNTKSQDLPFYLYPSLFIITTDWTRQQIILDSPTPGHWLVNNLKRGWICFGRWLGNLVAICFQGSKCGILAASEQWHACWNLSLRSLPSVLLQVSSTLVYLQQESQPKIIIFVYIFSIG